MTAPRSSLAAADAYAKADSVINKMGYERIAVSVSGGSDSDIVVDIITSVDHDRKCRYRYFDTGLEFDATKRHLTYLEERYGITIDRVQPFEKVGTACKRRGLPFLSKQISQCIGRLQRVEFGFDETPEDVLLERYTQDHIVRHIKWWTNGYPTENGRPSKYTVAIRRWLKEWMLENPPTFPISDECCLYAKKLTARRDNEESGIELEVIGVRKAEGGVRANSFTTCFSQDNAGHGYSVYRPVWWFTDEDKRAYEEERRIVHSDCYTIYGMTRTGCALCPYSGRELWRDMLAVKDYEPVLYRLAWNLFGPSYEYLRGYQAFAREMDARQSGQPALFYD